MPEFAPHGEAARGGQWTPQNRSPDRAWRPGLYHLDPRRLGAGIIWLPKWIS